MENEYNKRFKNKEMSNDDFDVEGLWDDIANELDTNPSNTLVFPWRKLGLGLILLLGLCGIGLITFGTSETVLIGENTSVVEERSMENSQTAAKVSSTKTKYAIEKQQGNSTLKNSAQVQHARKENATIKNESQKLISQPKPETIGNIFTQKNNTLKKAKVDENNVTDEGKKNKDDNQASQTKNPNLVEIKGSTGALAQSTIKNEIQNSKETGIISPSIETEDTPQQNLDKTKTDFTIALFKTKIKHLAIFSPTIDDSLLYTGIREISKKKVNEDKGNKQKVDFEGGVYGGLNRAFVQFNSTSDTDYSDTRNTSENSFSGTTYGAQIGLLYKGWRVNTGTELNNVWTKLDTKIQSNSNTFIPQALTYVLIDSTGNVLNQNFQDTTVNTTNTRTIVHHNNFQILSIPLEIGRYRASKQWVYGFSAGTSFNFLSNQTGKILGNDNELLEFNKDTDAVLFQPFSMSLRANAILAYKFSKNTLLSFNPQWSWTQNNLFDNTIKANVHQVNLNLSLRTIF